MFVVQTSKIQEAHTQEGPTEWMNPSPEACCIISRWDPMHSLKSLRMQSACEAHFAVADLQSMLFMVETARYATQCQRCNAIPVPTCDYKPHNPNESEQMPLDEADIDTDNSDGIQDRSVTKKPRVQDVLASLIVHNSRPPLSHSCSSQKNVGFYRLQNKRKSTDRMCWVMDLRKSKVFDNHFDSVEHNEKESDVVVGIDMLLVMVFHPPQGDPMI